MPIKRSAIFLVMFTIGSVGLLSYSSTKISSSPIKTFKCCEGYAKTTLFSPWNIMPQSLLFIKG